MDECAFFLGGGGGVVGPMVGGGKGKIPGPKMIPSPTLPSTAFKDNFPTMQDIGLVKLSVFEFNSFGKWVIVMVLVIYSISQTVS